MTRQESSILRLKESDKKEVATMSERRMFSKSITESDAFLDLPPSAQVLYFHLSMNADDEGFINSSKRIRNMCGASDEDMRLLEDKAFLIHFESGIYVIKHWKINNRLRKDRTRKTNYPEEKAMLTEKDNGVYSLRKDSEAEDDTETSAEHCDSFPTAETTEMAEDKEPESDESDYEEEEADIYEAPEGSDPLEYTAESDARKSYSERIFDLYSTHGLPCANNIISFEMRDFKLALSAIQKLHLSSTEVIKAVENYIQVVELKRKGLTWWSSEQSFNAFCEKNTIMKFLPGYFKLEDFYKQKDADKKALDDKIQL